MTTSARTVITVTVTVVKARLNGSQLRLSNEAQWPGSTHYSDSDFRTVSKAHDMVTARP